MEASGCHSAEKVGPLHYEPGLTLLKAHRLAIARLAQRIIRSGAASRTR